MASDERESNEILDSSTEFSNKETFAESEVIENFGGSYISKNIDTDSTYYSTSSNDDDDDDDMEDKEINNFENCVPEDFCKDLQNISDQKISKNDSNDKIIDDEYSRACRPEIRYS